MTTELAINLLAAGLSFGIGIAYTRVRRWRQFQRPGKRVWGVSRGDSVTFITADGPETENDQYTTTVYPAEYAAALEIAHYLGGELGCKVDRICMSSDFKGDKALEGNLVVIGGPVHNVWFKRLFEELQVPFRFDAHSLVDLQSGKFYDAGIEGGAIVEDVALVVLAPNPFNPENRVVLVAGCRTFGCQAGARHLVHPCVRETASRVGENSWFLVRSKVIDKYVVNGEIFQQGLLPVR